MFFEEFYLREAAMLPKNKYIKLIINPIISEMLRVFISDCLAYKQL